MVKSKRDSILRINKFSDSESEQDENQIEEDVEMENPEENSGTVSNDGIEENQDDKAKVKQKIVKPKKVEPNKTGKKGIIYISQIPKHMNVTIVREMFESFGEVGRIYLQPDQKSKGEKNPAQFPTNL